MTHNPELPFSASHESAEEMGTLLTEREVLEGMSPNQLVDFILEKGEKVTNIESIMSLASDVLEGAYGTTVEQVLNERKINGNQT